MKVSRGYPGWKRSSVPLACRISDLLDQSFERSLPAHTLLTSCGCRAMVYMLPPVAMVSIEPNYSQREKKTTKSSGHGCGALG